MAFVKANLELFLKNHERDMPPSAFMSATQMVSQIEPGELLVADEATEIFGDEQTAQWFLREIEGSRQHQDAFISSVTLKK